jgi:hypothetical protein
MPDPKPSTRDTQESGAFTRALSLFLRSSFTYPANNRRVLELRGQLLGELDAIGASVQIQLDESQLLVGGQPVSLEDPAAQWLHAALFRSALGGLRLERRLGAEQLVQFAERLRQAFVARPKHFELHWSEDLGGISLAPPQAVVHLSSSEESEASETTELRQKLRAMLEEDGELLGQLEGREEGPSPGEIAALTTRVDLLELIQNALPAEALVDAELACTLARRVLMSCKGELLDVGGAAMSGDVESKIVDVGLRLFAAHRELDREDTDEALPEGRAGDERIADDMESMLHEFAQLDPAQGALIPVAIDPPGEELFSIYMHCLRSAEEPETQERSRRLLAELILDSPESMQLLLTYADRCFESAVPTREEWQALDLVLAQGLPEELGLPDWRDPSVLEAAFPHLFGRLLQSVADRESGAGERLLMLVELLGPERLALESAAILKAPVFESELHSEALLDALDEMDDPVLLPLYWIQMEAHVGPERAPILRRLRRWHLPVSALGALRALPAGSLSDDYLRALCRVGPSEEAERHASDLSSGQLRSFVLELLGEDSRDEDSRDEELSFALRMLPLHLCSQNVRLVQQIARGSAELPGRPSALLRSAATQALRQMSMETPDRRGR